MIETSAVILVNDLQVRDRCLAAGAPVDNVFSAIDQPFLKESDKDFSHGAGQPRIEREALARPVAGCPEPDHLPFDRVPALSFPLPNFLLEGIAAKGSAVQFLLGKLPLDDHLGRDAGVVGTGQPERVGALHALPADDNVNLGMLQHVPHVERTGYIRRRNHQRKHRSVGIGMGLEQALLDPLPRPARLDLRGIVRLCNFSHVRDSTIPFGCRGRQFSCWKADITGIISTRKNWKIPSIACNSCKITNSNRSWHDGIIPVHGTQRTELGADSHPAA